jgi:hypothetical protein
MIQEISYGGWKRNLRLQGPTTELVITLDVGPRIIRYALHGGKNVFVEIPGQIGKSGEKEWMIRGGHRFWTAPEAGHSYELDNGPVEWKKLGDCAVEIAQPESKAFGFRKTLVVEMLEDEVVRVTHRLANTGAKVLDVTPWALSVMAPGGVAIIPQPVLDLHPTEFPEGRDVKPHEYLPNRELVLWPFTNLADGRYTFSQHFLRVAHAAGKPATKLGLKLPASWIAYHNGDDVFAKHVSFIAKQPYPDRGVNFEIFTNNAILELETLAPSAPLQPGAAVDHVEHWALGKAPGDLRREECARDFFHTLPHIRA